MSVNSIDKIIEYVSRVSKVPVWFNGKCVLPSGIEQVKVTEKFFYKDNCVMCGRCCPNENTAFTEEGMNRIKMTVPKELADRELAKGIKKEVHSVNKRDKVFYSFPADSPADCQRWNYEGRPKYLPRCHWLDLSDEEKHPCLIHKCRSITCGMPHIRFYHKVNSTTTSIATAQYGRNHQMGCPVKFEAYDSHNSEHIKSCENKIKWLSLLSLAAEDLGVETWLPEILERLQGHPFGESFVLQKGVKKLFEVKEYQCKLKSD